MESSIPALPPSWKKTAIVLAVLWVAIVVAMAAMTWGAVGADGRFKKQVGSLVPAAARDALRDELRTCLWHSEEFVDLYGLWCRAIDKRMCNRVVRFHGDQLLRVFPERPQQPFARALVDLSAYVKACGKKFLYVQSPSKVPLEFKSAQHYPRFCHNDNAETLFMDAAGKGVQVVDLRPVVARDFKSIDANFLKSDHHWTYGAAFAAYQFLCPRLVAAADEAPHACQPFIDKANWKEHQLPRRYMGAYSRRTGAYFTELDDFYYPLPVFPTAIVKSIPEKSYYRAGDFAKAIIVEKRFAPPNSKFWDGAYAMFGDDEAITTFRNAAAPVRKKLLVAKDSFASPVVAYLTTVFEAIDVVDLRHLKGISLKRYLAITQPDVVCVMYNPGACTPQEARMWSFGNEQDPGKIRGEKLQCRNRFDIATTKDAWTFDGAASFTAGTASVYRVSMSVPEVLAGNPDAVSVGVYDMRRKYVLKRETFSIDYLKKSGRKAEWLLFGLEAGVPYRIVVYPGEAGKSKGCSLGVRNLELEAFTQ